MKFRFFISCPEQLEAELRQEIEEVWPWLQGLDGRPHSEALEIVSDDRGGVEILTPLHLGLQLNFHLRLAHRILFRLQKFNCRELSQLSKLFSKLPLRDWLGDLPFGLKVAAAKSKINNEKRIEQAFLEHWGASVRDEAEQTVFIRAFDDEFVVSLDSSGEHLHFRGLEKSHGEAPLRENLAHFAFRQLLRDSSWSALSNVHLMDPMAGSGTFLFEAALLAAPLPRRYAFQSWKPTPVILKNPPVLKPPPLWHKLSGFDLNVESISTLCERWQNAGFSVDCEIAVRDLFRDEPENKIEVQNRERENQTVRRWLVLNPPYGIRLPAHFKPEQLLRRCFEIYQPERMSILFSKDQARNTPAALAQYRKIESQQVSSGGLGVEFQLWTRS